ncbi:hypothetical protein F7U66_01655 [Vibrio parahaemolyticus]|nr:hypothetical protein [Vibrio parahaemolyticus]
MHNFNLLKFVFDTTDNKFFKYLFIASISTSATVAFFAQDSLEAITNPYVLLCFPGVFGFAFAVLSPSFRPFKIVRAASVLTLSLYSTVSFILFFRAIYEQSKLGEISFITNNWVSNLALASPLIIAKGISLLMLVMFIIEAATKALQLYTEFKASREK